MSDSTRRWFPLALCGALVACGGGGGDDGTAGGGASGADVAGAQGIAGVEGIVADGLVGLWDVSEGQDELYFEIRSDARATFWDYLGDGFDRGPNCYLRSDDLPLVAAGDGGVILALDGVASGDAATLTREGDLLVARYVDTDDDDGDGDVTETLEDRVPAAAGLSSTDFAVCTDAQLDEFFGEPGSDGAFDDPAPAKRVLGTDLSAYR